MSTDLITEIQAQPRVFAERLRQAEAALVECRAALYGCREIVGNIGNVAHAIELADAVLRGAMSDGK